MLAPYVASLVLFFLVPFIFAVAVSFTHWAIIGRPTFVGVSNYLAALRDPSVLQALWNTCYYTVMQSATLIMLGLGLALLLNASIPGTYIARTLVVLPYVISVSVMGILWRWMYDPNFGIINYYLGKLGVPRLWWLTDPTQAMPSIVIADWWWTVGFTTVVYLAGLQGVPRELYEAAHVDGATGWDRFRYVTIPSLRPVTLYAVVINTIASFQMFGESFVMTQGGPLGATTTLTYRLYIEGFFNLQLGYAAALSVLFLIAVTSVTALEFRVLQRASD
jgi:multiple sugar transport system permease protein